MLMEAEETVTLALVALRVPDRLALPPATTLPKPRLAGLTPNWPAAVPVPEMGIVRFGFEPFDTTEIVPLALAADVAAKLALKVKLCPAVRVMGGFKPLMLKPVPEAVAWEIVRLEPPVFITVSERILLSDTCTLPMLRLEGLPKSRDACWQCGVGAGQTHLPVLLRQGRTRVSRSLPNRRNL